MVGYDNGYASAIQCLEKEKDRIVHIWKTLEGEGNVLYACTV